MKTESLIETEEEIKNNFMLGVIQTRIKADKYIYLHISLISKSVTLDAYLINERIYRAALGIRN